MRRGSGGKQNPHQRCCIRPKKRNLFVSCNGPKNFRVGRSVKKIFSIIFLVEKCVFYACFMLIGSWEGGKNFRVGIIIRNYLFG